jgi:GT2 family glycosyltransferase
MDIVVQIVSYQTKHYLSDCLNSVLEGLKGFDISFKILILENGSGENLSDIENNYKNEPLAFYYSDKNLGFGAGHNLLAKKGNSTYLFALNPDTILSKESIRKLFAFMEAHSEVGLCGPRIDEGDNFLGFWWHKWHFWPPRFTLKSFFEKFLKISILRNLTALEFNPILGSALFFRRKAFQEIHGFDENLFLYFEENDICNSLKTKKWKIYFVYNALITHFYHRSEKQPQNSRYFKESKRYFHKKWPQGDIRH